MKLNDTLKARLAALKADHRKLREELQDIQDTQISLTIAANRAEANNDGNALRTAFSSFWEADERRCIAKGRKEDVAVLIKEILVIKKRRELPLIPWRKPWAICWQRVDLHEEARMTGVAYLDCARADDRVGESRDGYRTRFRWVMIVIGTVVVDGIAIAVDVVLYKLGTRHDCSPSPPPPPLSPPLSPPLLAAGGYVTPPLAPPPPAAVCHPYSAAAVGVLHVLPTVVLGVLNGVFLWCVFRGTSWFNRRTSLSTRMEKRKKSEHETRIAYRAAQRAEWKAQRANDADGTPDTAAALAVAQDALRETREAAAKAAEDLVAFAASVF